MALVGRHVRVTGHVQGVFYRAWAQGEARELGISGWIRNYPDGTVEAELSGEEADVTRMIQRLQRGPSNARVEHVDVEEIEPQESGRFELRR